MCLYAGCKHNNIQHSNLHCTSSHNPAFGFLVIQQFMSFRLICALKREVVEPLWDPIVVENSAEGKKDSNSWDLKFIERNNYTKDQRQKNKPKKKKSTLQIPKRKDHLRRPISYLRVSTISFPRSFSQQMMLLFNPVFSHELNSCCCFLM